MKQVFVSLIVGAVVAYLATKWVSDTALKGAQDGGSMASPKATMAYLFPDRVRKEQMPFSLAMGGGAGLIVFGITYLIIRPRKSKQVSDYPD